jgi:hypothetical protein
MRKSQLLTSIEEIERSQVGTIPARRLEAQEEVEAAKFNLGQENLSYGELASVDEGLQDLPDGYGESRIVLMPRDPLWAYVYWDVANEHKEKLRSQGGQQLALRVYDVTSLSLDSQRPHNMQEYPCNELARDWYLPIPVSDRDYLVEIGYRCADGRWLVLAQSTSVRIPPVHPSDWVEEHFIEVNWNETLQEKYIYTLSPPAYLATPVFEEAPNSNAYWTQYAAGSNQHLTKASSHTAGSLQQLPGSLAFMSNWIDEVGLDQVLVKTNGWKQGFTQVLTDREAKSSVLASTRQANLDCATFRPTLNPQRLWLVADADLMIYAPGELETHVSLAKQSS